MSDEKFGAVVDVIVKHNRRPFTYPDNQQFVRCHCGWSADFRHSHKTGIRLHAEHVIDALAEEVGVPGTWIL